MNSIQIIQFLLFAWEIVEFFNLFLSIFLFPLNAFEFHWVVPIQFRKKLEKNTLDAFLAGMDRS